jgi:general secretion pathway protein D
MRSACLIAVLVLAIAAFAADAPSCRVMAGSNGVGCQASARDIKQARQEFERGINLRSTNLAEAYKAFEQAARLVPEDAELASAREITRQQLVFERVQQGNKLMQSGQKVEGLAEFRSALELDPNNEFAQQRMRDALGRLPGEQSTSIKALAQSAPLTLEPQPGQRDFHYRGEARGLFTAIATAFGLRVSFDESFVSRTVRFDVERVDFETAINTAGRMTKNLWAPVESRRFIVAADNRDNRNRLERMVLRTFYVPDAASPQELTEIITILRSIFEVRLVQQQAAQNTITVRAPYRTMEAVTTFMETFGLSRPQVMLEVKVYEVNRSMLHSVGLDLPLQFQMFSVSAEALALLQNTNIQDLINQLIASGGINQAGNTAISALLAQLQNQQNSIFSQPFALFGGGSTLFALTFPTATAKFSASDSRVVSLEDVTVRAAHNAPATIRIGSRYPLLNATFSPIFNTPALAQVIQNASFQAPFPSFSFEDLGLTVKVTPLVQGTTGVTLQMELQIRSLGTQSFNGVPVIGTREYSGALMLKDGEPAVVAGTMSRSEARTVRGIPALGQVPVAGVAASSHDKQVDETELVMVITPHIVSSPIRQPASISMPPPQ